MARYRIITQDYTQFKIQQRSLGIWFTYKEYVGYECFEERIFSSLKDALDTINQYIKQDKLCKLSKRRWFPVHEIQT